MPKRYIDQYVDEGLTPSDTFTVEDIDEITEKHIVRLAREVAIAQIVRNHKRRLGPEANPRELAADKTFAKRYGYGAESLLTSWDVSPHRMDYLIKKEERSKANKQKAAQIDWHEHILTLCAYLRHEMRQIATNASYHNLPKEGSKLVLRLENELYLQTQRYEKVFGNPVNPTEIPEYDPKTAQNP